MVDTILTRAPTNKLALPSDTQKKQKVDKAKARARVKGILDKRLDYEKRWKSIRDYQLPFVGFFDDTADNSNAARRRDMNILNGIAWEAVQIFAAGVMSGLTPPSRQWFKFAFSDRRLADNTDLAAILDERQEILTSVLAKSNFYNAIHNVYTELPFGQCPLGIFAGGKAGIFFSPFTIGTYGLDINACGEVDTFVRRYKLTPVQMAEQFGEENLPRNVKDALKNNSTKYTNQFNVCWLVEQNRESEGGISRFDMPYLSLYWVENSDESEWLYVGGFHEWPIPTARYLVTGNEAYAKGAGWFAEGDAKMLQLLEKDSLMAAELGVKPPMQATQKATRQGINLIPGGATIVEDLANPIVPLFNVNVNIEHLQYKIKEVEAKIKRTYNADLFLMLDQLDKGQMTAREVMERTQERLQQLGPVVERLQDEFLNPIIERVYGILDRAGVFPDFPEEMLEVLDGQDVKIEYLSPLAQAQKMSGLVSIEQAIAFVAQMAQLWPETVDKIDALETINRYFEMLGAPATIRRSEEDLAQIQQQKQEAAMQEQQMQQMMQAAPAINQAAQAAKNLTEAAQDGNPATEALLGL